MNKSDSISLLAKSFTKAQAEVEGARKDTINPYFKSKYADLASVQAAIKPSLAKHGLSFTQICHDAPDAAKVETVILHESGEWLSCGVISVPVSKNDAQGYGSAITYARRYSLSAAFGVAPEDDDGNAAASAPPEPTDAERKAMHDEAAEKYADAIIAIKDGISEGNLEPAAHVWFELPAEAKEALWRAPTKGGIFTTKERDTIKSSEFRKAHYGEAA